MPATEQTWRNINRLHFFFGISGLGLLVATLWMFAKDHDRAWKNYQKAARRIDVRMSNWRAQQFETEEFEDRTRELQRQLEAVRSSGLPKERIDDFQRAVNQDARTRGLKEHDFSRVDQLVKRMNTAAERAEAARRELLQAQVQVDRITTQREAAAAEGGEATADELAEFDKQLAKAKADLERAQRRVTELEEEAKKPRQEVLDELQEFVADARFREEVLLQKRKFAAADLDKLRADLGLAVRDNRPPDVQQAMQKDIDKQAAEVESLTLQYQEASRHRIELQRILTEMTETQSDLEKQLADHLADRERLLNSIREREASFFTGFGPGKRWLELPILDAFSSPLQIENLWSDGLEQDFNFRKVRRFDRCTTCHQNIAKTMPGSAVDPAFVHERRLELALTPVSGETSDEDSGDAAQTPASFTSVEQYFGLRLADEGLLNRDDVTVSFVAPYSLAAAARLVEDSSGTMTGTELRERALQPITPEIDDARAGLLIGDVIEQVNGDYVRSAEQTRFRLEEAARNQEPVTLTIRRGLPHPFVSHPRLDLFVGSLSPHDVSQFACTICHEGQGSATEFKWASHTPNSPRQRSEWAQEHGWFDNHHWIYPMYAKRFLESSCLKCHHEVTELKPSERFPEPPAPKLMHGYDLITKYGCFGCHEINGFSGDQRIGPDLRLEPNYFAAAQALKYDAASWEAMSDDEKAAIEQLIASPERDDLRRRVLEMLTVDERGDGRFTDYARLEVAPMLKDLEAPGTLRKPGPSLRFVNEKLDTEFLFDWIRDPQNYRPSTRMPTFFGLWDHLSGEGKKVAEAYEPIEILGIVRYLQARSQPFEFLPRPEGITESTVEEKIERGRIAFQERGCLACHSHKEFPEIAKFRAPGEIQQGPDLSNLGDKFHPDRNPKGRDWLYTWIKQPTKYHVRTVMPDLFLDPVEARDPQGNVLGVYDPVEDIVEFLLADASGEWQPAEGTLIELDDASREALDNLTLDHLRDSFYVNAAERYLKNGIPQEMAPDLKGPEKELLVDENSGGLSDEQKLRYIGRKSIAKYGCYGCHDVPGFEDAKPIGTGLADWGRKEPEKLAFEHIAQYLEGHGHGHGGSSHGVAHSADHADEDSQGDEGEARASDEDESGESLGAGETGQALAGARREKGPMPEFYEEQLMSGNRIGFLYQKLREPRSYDYHKTENKRYNERLRMPQFPFNDEQREAIITFVLGLVADPPSTKYVYQPDERQKALIAGRKVLEKYNCAGCHMLEGDRWHIAYAPGSYGEQQRSPTYPFVLHHFPEEEIQQAATPDRRNLLHSQLVALPMLSNDGLPLVNDDYGEPLYEDDEYSPKAVEYALQLMRPAILDGHVYQTGEGAVYVPMNRVERFYPAEGGDLTKYLLPYVVEREQEVNTAAKGSEAWGWLPPPLLDEGIKVQTEWLHEFLLNPYPIRPAVVLRMPRFNMSSEEASVLVNYFAARDDADYPYEFAPRRQTEHLARADEQYRRQVEQATGEAPATGARFHDAMQIVTNQNYCVQCHIVGDYDPMKDLRGKGPDLTQVYRRFRPDYLRKWIAKPQSILPYTGMPVNIAYDPDKPFTGSVVPQNLYHGDSIDQLDGLVDLLMNYDVFARQRSLVQPLVQQQLEQSQQAEPEEPATEPAADAAADASASEVETTQASGNAGDPAG